MAVGAAQIMSQPVSSIFPCLTAAPWHLANSRFVHSLMLSSNLFLCLPCLLPPFTEPCKMVLARRDERETCPYHYGLRLFTMVRKSLCGPVHVHVRMQIHTSPRRCHTDTHQHRHTRKHTDTHSDKHTITKQSIILIIIIIIIIIIDNFYIALVSD